MTKERKNRMHFIKRIASLTASIVMILSMSVSRQPQIMAVTEPLDIHLTIETKEIDIDGKNQGIRHTPHEHSKEII